MHIPKDYFTAEHFSPPRSTDGMVAIFKRSVTNVNVEISSYCNRKCTYCPVSQVDRLTTNKRLPEGIFRKVVSDLASINYDKKICLNLYYEPTADKTLLLTRIEEIRKGVPLSHIYFSSNGDYLDIGYLVEMVEAGISELYITLHPPRGKPYNDLYVIQRLTEMSARLRRPVKMTWFAPNEAIHGTMTICGINVHIFSTNYDRLGSDRGGAYRKPKA